MTGMYYDGAYQRHNPAWHEEDSSWKARHVAAMLARSGLSPASVGEVGCGAGAVLVELSQLLGASVTFTGYDISPQAHEICRLRATDRVQFLLKDILQEDVRFDLVIAMDVMEHVEDYVGFLRGLKEKGTYKILHIPLDLSVQSVLRCSPIMHARRSVGHLHYFTSETALATLEHAGYEVLNSSYTSGALDLPSHSIRSTLLRLPRKLFFAVHQGLAARILGGFSMLVLAR